MTLQEEIDAAIAAGDHELVADLSCELQHPSDHLRYMLTAWRMKVRADRFTTTMTRQEPQPCSAPCSS